MHTPVRLILEGPYAGKTIKLGDQQFTEGVCELEGTLESNAGLIKYMRRCYQARPDGDAVKAGTQAKITRLVLEGPYAGMTIKLGEFLFTNGVLELDGPPEKNAGIVKFVDRCWQAKLEKKVEDGKRYSQEDQRPEVESEVQPEREGVAEEVSAVNTGVDSTEADEGSELQAEGNGREDDAEAEVSEFTSQQLELREILKGLDPEDDSHWTKGKAAKPAWPEVKLRLGINIEYKQITDAWPGFNRAIARKLRTE
jgi:hypothetical protein